ncbi:MAG: hypothetical protein ACK5HY_18245 [Parahaliea sp.]
MNAALKAHIKKEAIANFVINLAINAWLAWLIFSSASHLNAFGENAYVPDLAIMGVILSMIVAAIVMPLHRYRLRKSKLATCDGPQGVYARLAGKSTWTVVLVFGCVGGVVALLVGLAVSVISPTLSPMAYTAIKGLLAGVLAVIVVVPTIQLALYQDPDVTEALSSQ